MQTEEKNTSKILRAEYIYSAALPEQFRQEECPRLAFIGRSNVGKSSLINSLTGRRNLARVSAQPGKTQTINYFDILFETAGGKRCSFELVDLPGYGYAKAAKSNRRQWAKVTEQFLQEKNLRCICQLIDLRHPPLESDIAMFNWLIKNELPTFIIATKSDKLSKNNIQKNLAVIRKTLSLPADAILPYSSEKNDSRSYLLDFITQLLIE